MPRRSMVISPIEKEGPRRETSEEVIKWIGFQLKMATDKYDSQNQAAD